MALVTALIGVILMILTLVWRINPVEGSVVPRYLTGTAIGVAVICFLFVTCMPAWISGVYLAHVIPMVNPYDPSGRIVTCCLMFIIQFMLYLGLGHMCSRLVRAVGRRRRRSRIEQAADELQPENKPSD